MKVIHWPEQDEGGRLVIKFVGDSEIYISGTAGSADLALAAAILLKLSVDSLEQ